MEALFIAVLGYSVKDGPIATGKLSGLLFYHRKFSHDPNFQKVTELQRFLCSVANTSHGFKYKLPSVVIVQSKIPRFPRLGRNLHIFQITLLQKPNNLFNFTQNLSGCYLLHSSSQVTRQVSSSSCLQTYSRSLAPPKYLRELLPKTAHNTNRNLNCLSEI